MKKITLLFVFISFSTLAQAQDSWWNSLLNSVGLGDDKTEAVTGPSLDGMVANFTSALGVTPEQAKGGLAALFNYAKQNVSQEQFNAITEQIPGLATVMQYLPAVSKVKQGGMGGLMDMAASVSEPLAQVNDLKKQFDTLGLDTGMIQQYITQAQTYLDTPEGQEAKKMLSDSLTQISI